MNTSSLIFPVKSDTLNAKFSQCESLSQCDEQFFIRYTEINRFLEEIHDIFNMFYYNLQWFEDSFSITFMGEISFRKKFLSPQEIFIAANANLINIISAGKTLIDALDNFVTSPNFKPGSKQNNYSDYRRSIFASSFAYQFMYFLRNFSQHGHLPISYDASSRHYYFDLWRILETPHYDWKNKDRVIIERIKDEIMKKYAHTPSISIMITFAQYIKDIADLYEKFWCYIADELLQTMATLPDIIKKYPKNNLHDTNSSIDFFVFQLSPRVNGITTENAHQSIYYTYHAQAIDFFTERERKLAYILKEIAVPQSC